MPYFGVEGSVYTQDNVRAFGMDFGRALEKYLQA